MIPSPPETTTVRARPRPLERLEAEIVELASQLTAATARLIALVGEFDAAEGWRDWGMASTAHWLSWQCGLGLRAAREQVRVARALHELPAIAGAFATARLSYSKVRAVTRVATPESEAELLHLAEHSTGAQLERLVVAHRRAGSREDAADQRRREYFNIRIEPDGTVTGSFRLAPERGLLVMQALDAEDRCSAEHRDEPRPARVDAFVEVCRRSIVDAAASASGDAHQLVLHTTREDLAAPDDGDDVGSGGVLQTARGASVRVHQATARRLTCDCPATEMIDDADGAALHVGRRSRRIRGRLRRAVEARDRGRCRAPGCTAAAAGAHHIRHWANGGVTCLRNLVSLCELHHWLVHEGGWQIAVPEPGRWVFLAPDGRRVTATPPAPAEPTPMTYDDDIAPDAVTGHWAGQRLDLDLALHSLLAPSRPSSRRVAGTRPECSAEHSAPAGFQFDMDTINAWADEIERMVGEARPADAICVDD